MIKDDERVGEYNAPCRWSLTIAAKAHQVLRLAVCAWKACTMDFTCAPLWTSAYSKGLLANPPDLETSDTRQRRNQLREHLSLCLPVREMELPVGYRRVRAMLATRLLSGISPPTQRWE